MDHITVNAEHPYDVCIGVNWHAELLSLLRKGSRVAIVISSALRDRLDSFTFDEVELHILEIPDGEPGKDLATLDLIWSKLGEWGFTRSDLLVAIGGGATTDIAGFAAATWLRGIDWISVPTTLAGMVDAAIGGKTGMNSSFGKNLIGAFHSPQAVLVDVSWLETLSNRDFSAGLAEVLKSGFIADAHIIELLAQNSLEAIRDSKVLTQELISRSVAIKARVVSEDFREGFAREVLNYGHTLGHAVELHSNFDLRHGEAISIGLVYVAELAHLKGLLSQEMVDLHRSLLKKLGLPISYPESAWEELMTLMSMDKKARGSQVRFVAISEIGKTLRLEEITPAELKQAYERVSS